MTSTSAGRDHATPVGRESGDARWSEPTTPIALTPADFRLFFTECWGEDKSPFAWQMELARRVLRHRLRSVPNGSRFGGDAEDGQLRIAPWPEAVELPTGAGKTACIDISVFALAAQAGCMTAGRQLTAPRRIFFVVDRRVIVDEAFERAQRLARILEEARHGILRKVADNLRSVARGDTAGFERERPLVAHVLRGGLYRSESWARNPLQPTIVASTVDQVGSRLLFRAYGRSSGTWPIYAGLVANDSIIFLDEAHCAQPFMQTLRAVGRFRGEEWADDPIKRCFHAVVMSATPPPGITDVFRDESEQGRDVGHPLGKRQLASKPAGLRSVTAAQGANATVELSKALVEEAIGLLEEERNAIVVFVNRVATARETHRQLSEYPRITVLLLTGRMRPVDKESVLRRLRALQLDSSHSRDRDLDQPVVIVATQTLEVGADLDFDGLVTECASLDALRQRFGRLNRMGREIKARGRILIRQDQERPRRGQKDDPIYGSALTATWQWLNGHKDNDGQVDFGIARMDDLLKGSNGLPDLQAPSPDAPVMLPAHIDCWAQTHPEPRPTPDVAPFLRGPSAGHPDVQVCWRADVTLVTSAACRHALESLRLCPPSSGEILPVPVGVFRRWLAGSDSGDDTGDVEGSPMEEEQVDDSRAAERRVVRWVGAKTNHDDITSDPGNIRPGDIVVIPTTHLGHWHELGDFPPEAATTSATLDVGDPGHRMARAKPILRLHTDLVAAWPDAVTTKKAGQDLLDTVERTYEEDPHGVARAVHRVLTGIAESDADLPDRWVWLPDAAAELASEYSAARLRRELHIVGENEIIVAGRRHIRCLAHTADNFSDEDDSSASGTSHRSGTAVGLEDHLTGVQSIARLHASASGLPKDMVGAFALAGQLHDSGKADPRFQAMLRGGYRSHSGPLLAKSAGMPKTRRMWRRAREAAGYPAGRPHPMLSTRLAEQTPTLDTHTRDLVLHLVASHHGQCRPFAPVIADDDPVDVAFRLNGTTMQASTATGLERLDSGIADRYWRLTRRYGWWGLAWLEALLRLADWRQSESEQMADA